VTAGGSFTDIGICTTAAPLHRDDYKQLLGTDKNSWVLTTSRQFVHNGHKVTVPVEVKAVRGLGVYSHCCVASGFHPCVGCVR
jgi:hypothetical protein